MQYIYALSPVWTFECHFISIQSHSHVLRASVCVVFCMSPSLAQKQWLQQKAAESKNANKWIYEGKNEKSKEREKEIRIINDRSMCHLF